MTENWTKNFDFSIPFQADQDKSRLDKILRKTTVCCRFLKRQNQTLKPCNIYEVLHQTQPYVYIYQNKSSPSLRGLCALVAFKKYTIAKS